ncbi:MAG: RDD family protein [Rhodothermales bacterium]
MEPTHEEETHPTPETTAETTSDAAESTASEVPAPVTTTGAVPEGKADLGKRFVAMLIDGVLASVVGMIPFVGWLVAGAYMVVRDGLELDFMDGRSIGKKVMKLRPVRLDGGKMTMEDSVKRNWMWAVGYLALIPIIGWLLAPIIGLAALAISLFEIFKVLTDTEGRRWGDSIAGTKVIEVAS